MIRTHFGQHDDDCYGCKAAGVQFGKPAFQAHFNWSVGAYVRNEREYHDQLKICAERNSVATGVHHEYEPRMMSDVKPFAGADQVIDDRQKALHDGSVAHLLPKAEADA